MSIASKILYYLSILPTWVRMTVHNTWGIINVFFIVWVRPMKGGMITKDHPLATGINPETGEYIWPENIIFSSKRKKEFEQSDAEIVTAVGQYMRGMILKSSAFENFPLGKKDKMPPAINYIHGGVHYNGGFLIFDDFEDGIRHFSNPEFKKSFLNFIREEKREPVTLFRNRNYKREEFLEFACFMRTILPYFSNSNGNQKRIGWGNPSPYPAVNTITGNWMADTYKFYSKEELKTVARKPVAKRYFLQSEYIGQRSTALLPERIMARFTDKRVIARGIKGNLFFVDRRKIINGYRFDPAKLPNIVDRLQEKLLSPKLAVIGDQK